MKNIFLALVGAVTFALGGALLLPMIGMTMTTNLLLIAAAVGGVVGYAAGATGNSVLYGLLMLGVLVSAISVFFLNPATLEVMGGLGRLITNIVEGSGWLRWALWGGVHLFVGLMLSYWMSNPDGSLADAAGAAAGQIVNVIGGVAGAVVSAVGGALLSVVTGNPIFLVAGGVLLFNYLRKKRAKNQRDDYDTGSRDVSTVY